MKTIEERAKVSIPDAVNPDEVLPAREAFIVGQKRIAYILGACEQKAIDDAELSKLKSAWGNETQVNRRCYIKGYRDAVEKACVWLEKELQGIATDELKENFLENEFKLILKSQVPNWLINFRKAMEE